MDGVVTQEEAGYPARLRGLPGAPTRLYYKGRWEESLFADCLAVVGTRRMTSYGRQVTEQVVTEIAAAGITIVSGFMFGVDAEAHRAALAAGGRTIAVMPCGIERVTPAYQRDLYDAILQQGLIVSEVPGEAAPAAWTFPKRNRIVAGLSQATLVVEGAVESGSLITAAFARRYGRQVFAVPGPITSPTSLGPLKLLREGAALVTRAEDVLGFYGKPPPLHLHLEGVPESACGHLPGGIRTPPEGLQGRILNSLGTEPVELDALVHALQVTPAELGAALSLLELSGLVVETDGRYLLGTAR